MANGQKELGDLVRVGELPNFDGDPFKIDDYRKYFLEDLGPDKGKIFIRKFQQKISEEIPKGLTYSKMVDLFLDQLIGKNMVVNLLLVIASQKLYMKKLWPRSDYEPVPGQLVEFINCKTGKVYKEVLPEEYR